MIALNSLLQDSQYRQMTVEGLANVIRWDLEYMGYAKLEGEESPEKAQILFARWSAEAKAKEGMVCEWVRYAERKPTDNKDYCTLDEQEVLTCLQYDVLSDTWTHYPEVLSEIYPFTVVWWLDGLIIPNDKTGE